PSLATSLEANTSMPTFFGPAMTFAQALWPSQALTSMVKSCQRHLPSISCKEAADAHPPAESTTEIKRACTIFALPTNASPERSHEKPPLCPPGSRHRCGKDPQAHSAKPRRNFGPSWEGTGGPVPGGCWRLGDGRSSSPQCGELCAL